MKQSFGAVSGARIKLMAAQMKVFSCWAKRRRLRPIAFGEFLDERIACFRSDKSVESVFETGRDEYDETEQPIYMFDEAIDGK